MSKDLEIALIGVLCAVIVLVLVAGLTTFTRLSHTIVQTQRLIDAAQVLIPSKEVNDVIDQVQREAAEIDKREQSSLQSKRIKVRRYDNVAPE